MVRVVLHSVGSGSRRLAASAALAFGLATTAWGQQALPESTAAAGATPTVEPPAAPPVADPHSDVDAVLQAALCAASEESNLDAAVIWSPPPDAAGRVVADPMRSPVQAGEASWYGVDFDGRPTASGEVYDMYAFTVAHPSWPLGSILRIHNLENDRTTLARVNDRGPYARGRILDCSLAIAEALGFRRKGHARVQLTLLDPLPDAWTRFSGFPAPVAWVAPRIPPRAAMPQTSALLALAEDTSPVVAAVHEASKPSLLPSLLRTASVLPFPAIGHAWPCVSRWLLSSTSHSRWTRIERALEGFGVDSLVRAFIGQ